MSKGETPSFESCMEDSNTQKNESIMIKRLEYMDLIDKIKSMIPKLEGFDNFVDKIEGIDGLSLSRKNDFATHYILLGEFKNSSMEDGIDPLIVTLLDKNPGFKVLFEQYLLISKKMNPIDGTIESDITNQAAAELATCLESVQKGE